MGIKLRRPTDEVCSIVLRFFLKFVKTLFWTTGKTRVAVTHP